MLKIVKWRPIGQEGYDTTTILSSLLVFFFLMKMRLATSKLDRIFKRYTSWKFSFEKQKVLILRYHARISNYSLLNNKCCVVL